MVNTSKNRLMNSRLRLKINLNRFKNSVTKAKVRQQYYKLNKTSFTTKRSWIIAYIFIIIWLLIMTIILLLLIYLPEYFH